MFWLLLEARSIRTPSRWRLPSGAVQGDAHLEQFVVTDDDFGLADFDNAGYGPAIVDLVRYARDQHEEG